MFPRRKTEGFNIAFLDIMSCGLGAIVLLFVLLKYDVGRRPVEEDALSRDLTSLQQQNQDLKEDLNAVEKLNSVEERLSTELKEEVSKAADQLEAVETQILNQKQQIEQLKKDIETRPQKKQADVIEDPSAGEENYILGLRVEGSRIAILIDRSASMTDEKLVDIISRKTRSDSIKKRGQKWVRTQKIVRWLLGRLPNQSAISVIAFNDKSINVGPAQWNKGKDAAALEKIIADVEALIPEGPTNLQEGLSQLRKLNPKPTNLYLITDGLPTKGNSNYSGLVTFFSCTSLVGKSTTISGDCRKELFRQTLRDSWLGQGVTANVILLPIEGDPEAAPEYWDWTARTGGLLITPAENWP